MKLTEQGQAALSLLLKKLLDGPNGAEVRRVAAQIGFDLSGFVVLGPVTNLQAEHDPVVVKVVKDFMKGMATDALTGTERKTSAGDPLASITEYELYMFVDALAKTRTALSDLREAAKNRIDMTEVCLCSRCPSVNECPVGQTYYATVKRCEAESASRHEEETK